MTGRFAVLALAATLCGPALAQPADVEPLGIAMEGYPYPHPVQFLDLTIQGQDLRLAYMDIAAAGDTERGTVTLMHGKNFFGAYWAETIAALSAAGWRVVVPDQIGWGKSGKPDIHYSFHLLAQNTATLLDTLGIEETAVVGHSMGGMLAARFALMYPERTTALVMENPVGLEDYRRLVPFLPFDRIYESILGTTYDRIKAMHERYYVEWKPEYEDLVLVHYRWTLSGEYPRHAWNAALTVEMIYTQPVVHEFPDIAVPTLLVIGQEDRTKPGANRAAPEVAEAMGNYPALGRATQAAIPGSELVELENVGHIPHLEVPERFAGILLDFLRR